MQNVLKQKGKKRKSTKKPIRKSTQVRGLNPVKPASNLPDIGDAVHITGKGANKNERGTVIGYVKFARGWRVKLECMHNGQHYYCYASPHEFDVVRKVGGRTTLAAGRVNPKNDPRFPIKDWQYEVRNGDTRRGYLDWVASQQEQARDDEEIKKRQGKK